MNKRIKKKQERWVTFGKHQSHRGKAVRLPRRIPKYTTNPWNRKRDRAWKMTKRGCLLRGQLTQGDYRRARKLVRAGVLNLNHERYEGYSMWWYRTPSGAYAQDWRLFAWCLHDGLTHLSNLGTSAGGTVCVGYVRRGRYAGQWRAWGRVQWGHYATKEEAIAAAGEFY